MKLANLFAPGAGRYLLAAGALSMFAMGASQALYGPFFSHFGETLGVTPSRLGMLPGLHFAGATAGILAGGFLARRLGYRRILAVGALLLASGFAVVALAVAWRPILLGVGLIGLGFGVLVNLNILVDRAFGDLGPAALQLINATFSVGAISGPLLAAVSLSVGGQAVAFAVGSAISLVPLPLLLSSRTSALLAGEARASASLERNLRRRRVVYPTLLFMPLFLVYPGTEASFSSWMPPHLQSLLPMAAAGALASAFWLAFTLGRLVAVPVSMRLSPQRMVSAGLLLAGVASLAATKEALVWVAYPVAGFAIGPVFPGLLSWLRRRFPAEAGEASSLVMAAGGVGGIILPPAVGFVVESAGVVVIPIALAVILAGALIISLALLISGSRWQPRLRRTR